MSALVFLLCGCVLVCVSLLPQSDKVHL